MATRARVLNMFVEVLGYERGFWCRDCLLSTGVRHWIIVRNPAGMILQAKYRCHECGGHAVDPDRH